MQCAENVPSLATATTDFVETRSTIFQRESLMKYNESNRHVSIRDDVLKSSERQDDETLKDMRIKNEHSFSCRQRRTTVH